MQLIFKNTVQTLNFTLLINVTCQKKTFHFKEETSYLLLGWFLNLDLFSDFPRVSRASK